MSKKSRTLTERLVSYQVWVWSTLLAFIGAAVMFVSNLPWLDGHEAWRTTFNQLGAIFVTTGGLGVLWDIRAKRAFMDEVIQKARLSSEVDSTGLDRATMDWMDVPWSNLFSRAKRIEVFIAYGRSWRTRHWETLKEFATHDNHTLWMYFPDPEDEPTMHVLAQRYDYSVEKMKSHVRDAAQAFSRLGNGSVADVRVYYRAGDPTFTCYRFDDTYLITLYSHGREHGRVPTMLFDGKGSFGEFFKRDLEAIREQSTPVSLEELAQKEAGN
ncbi:hypothetical protein GCM10011374_10320 [Kocuria dechangensis]|uniref:Uncharacterized protein n=1 Tax=Kocuria dechangensis TaxID=1176249 RepID=A0A917LQB0_9MICC|nr:hypothetical protein [Kocuria dechangensis]GGG49753.1 hypothetical protein GCM10011374_10320 [Kocuria dechangensis]